MATSLADRPGAHVLDLTSSHELAKLDGRMEILDAQLDALGRLDELNEAIQFAPTVQAAAATLRQEPFNYSREQAKAVLEMPMSWQCEEVAEKLRAERKVLLARRPIVLQQPAEAASANWFG